MAEYFLDGVELGLVPLYGPGSVHDHGIHLGRVQIAQGHFHGVLETLGISTDGNAMFQGFRVADEQQTTTKSFGNNLKKVVDIKEAEW